MSVTRSVSTGIFLSALSIWMLTLQLVGAPPLGKPGPRLRDRGSPSAPCLARLDGFPLRVVDEARQAPLGRPEDPRRVLAECEEYGVRDVRLAADPLGPVTTFSPCSKVIVSARGPKDLKPFTSSLRI